MRNELVDRNENSGFGGIQNMAMRRLYKDFVVVETDMLSITASDFAHPSEPDAARLNMPAKKFRAAANTFQWLICETTSLG